jgi:hypothetical protein
MCADLSKLAAYALSGVNKVEGWLHNGAITSTVLLSRAQRNRGISGDVGEIGIHHGKYFLLLCHLQEDREDAVAIDVFDDQHLNIDRSGKGDRAIFESNILTFLGTGEKISIVQADSLSITVDVFTKLTNRKFRIFSIDGGHTISHVINDLNLAESTLDDYGMVVVDDFFDPGWPGVSEGMFRYWARGGRLRPFAYGDGKLFLSHRDAREDYYDIATTTLYPISLKGKKVELRGDVCLHLLMVGHGPMLASVQQAAKGCEDVTFFGDMANDEALRIISQSRLMVHTSLWEGVPRAIIESLTCGTPVVAFDFAIQGDFGQTRAVRLVSREDLEPTVRKLLDDVPGLDELSREARRFALETHGAQKLEEAAQQILRFADQARRTDPMQRIAV